MVYKDPQNFKEKRNTGVCGKNNEGYNAANSGNFTSKSEVAAISFNGCGDNILKSKRFSKFLQYSYDHNISASALIALVLAGALRPAAIMSIPGKKDKEDKIYAAGHSMASGIIGFVASTILTSPLDLAVKKLYADPDNFKSKNLAEINKKMSLIKDKLKNATTEAEKLALIKEKKVLSNSKNAYRQIIKNVPDWIIGVPRAMLTIALIPPILKYVFGVQKKPKGAPKQDPKAQAQPTPQQPKSQTLPAENKMNSTSMDLIDKPAFQDIKGGLK